MSTFGRGAAETVFEKAERPRHSVGAFISPATSKGTEKAWGTSDGNNVYHIMSSLSDYLYAVARRCRFRSRNTLDLAAAADLRELSEELDAKANECRHIECEIPVQIVSSKDRHGL